MNTTFKTALRKIRGDLNFTQIEMAELLSSMLVNAYGVGISYDTYVSWEQGRHEPAKTRFRPFGTAEILTLLRKFKWKQQL